MRIFFLICIVTLVACSSGVKGKNGVVYKSALEYNQYIVENQTDIINTLLEFVKLVGTNLDSAEMTLNKSVITTDRALVNVKGMPAYNGDTAFRNAAINLFTYYRDIFTHEYKEILDIKRKSSGPSTDDAMYMQSLVTNLGKREEVYDKKFHNSQRDFAKKNNLRLDKNEVQDKIDEMKQ